MGDSVQKQFGSIMAAARARTLGEGVPVSATPPESREGNACGCRNCLRDRDREAVRQQIADKAANARRTRLHSFGLAGGHRG